MWFQSCSLVSAILEVVVVWNSVGETRPIIGRGGDSGLRPHVRVQGDITVFVLTKRHARYGVRYGRAKTAKNGANHFQKQDLYLG